MKAPLIIALLLLGILLVGCNSAPCKRWSEPRLISTVIGRTVMVMPVWECLER